MSAELVANSTATLGWLSSALLIAGGVMQSYRGKPAGDLTFLLLPLFATAMAALWDLAETLAGPIYPTIITADLIRACAWIFGFALVLPERAFASWTPHVRLAAIAIALAGIGLRISGLDPAGGVIFLGLAAGASLVVVLRRRKDQLTVIGMVMAGLFGLEVMERVLASAFMPTDAAASAARAWLWAGGGVMMAAIIASQNDGTAPAGRERTIAALLSIGVLASLSFALLLTELSAFWQITGGIIALAALWVLGASVETVGFGAGWPQGVRDRLVAVISERRAMLRLIETMSGISKEDRSATKALAQGVALAADAREASFWLFDGQGHCRHLASSGRDEGEHYGLTQNLYRYLARYHEMLAVDEAQGIGVQLPAWLAERERAVVVPLVSRNDLIGFALVAGFRHKRPPSWQRRRFLTTLGAYAASFITEQQSVAAIRDAEQFVHFNRRAAFMVHDMKNIAQPLRLALDNAKRHRHDDAFYDDLLKTIDRSVSRLQGVITTLRRSPHQALPPIDLTSGLTEDVDTAGIAVEMIPGPVYVAVDRKRLSAVVGQLVRNARDATKLYGQVALRLMTENEFAVIEVVDDGPGMDETFMRERLFRPFASTKDDGLGLGLVEARDFVAQIGGEIQVASNKGRGTVLRLRLPLYPRLLLEAS
ncbi:MAG: ATP-binding protein [Geminicoccaceae bacterium]